MVAILDGYNPYSDSLILRLINLNKLFTSHFKYCIFEVLNLHFFILKGVKSDLTLILDRITFLGGDQHILYNYRGVLWHFPDSVDS